MLTQKAQAITGISPDYECVIEDVYPSIASTGIGDLLNRIFECIPVRVWGIKVSNVFALPLAPLGALVYLLQKVFGVRYLITNRNLKMMSGFGYRLLQAVPVTQIAGVSIDPDSRQAFFKSGDIRIVNAAGDTLMLLRGIPHPERFQQVILETRDARNQVAASLARIQARK